HAGGIIDVRHRRDAGARHVELVDPEQPLLFARHFAAMAFADRGDHEHVGTVDIDVEQPETCSRKTRRANRPKLSGYLTFRLSFFGMCGSRGSARIERLPSARGPNSIRPWNQPTALPSASACAVRSMSRSRGSVA